MDRSAVSADKFPDRYLVEVPFELMRQIVNKQEANRVISSLEDAEEYDMVGQVSDMDIADPDFLFNLHTLVHGKITGMTCGLISKW